MSEAKEHARQAFRDALAQGVDVAQAFAVYEEVRDSIVEHGAELTPASEDRTPATPATLTPGDALDAWDEKILSGELSEQDFEGMTTAELDDLEEVRPGLIEYATTELPQWRARVAELDRRRAHSEEQERLEADPEAQVRGVELDRLRRRLIFLSDRELTAAATDLDLDAEELKAQREAELARRLEPDTLAKEEEG